MKDHIRVLVVDDSPLIRDILTSMLESVSDFQVVGQAANGWEAVQLTARLRPDVITMDIRMPRLSGLEAIRQIMSTNPTPIVVITSSVYEADVNIAFNAIAAGALTVVEKPKGLESGSYDAVREQLVTTVRLMSDVQVITLWSGDASLIRPRSASQAYRSASQLGIELIAIAASTGGPGTLRQILGDLPGDMSIPIVVVQHITSGFGPGFAQWLNAMTPLQVAIAKNGDSLVPGHVLIAPEDRHITVAPDGIVMLDQLPPLKGHRPSATRLFASVAKAYGPTALGIVLTGMGDDGADGLELLRQVGGRVIAQDEASCAVFGMPKVAIERGIANQVLTPGEIASTLMNLNEYHRVSPAF